MTRLGWTSSALALALLSACGDGDAATSPNDAGPASDGGDANTSSFTGAATGDDGPGATSGADGPSSTDEGDTLPGGFVLPPDGGAANECDPKAQDCDRGEKCTAWANDGGGFWNANRCVEILGDGVEGDACMVQGSGVSGVDDCALGFICLNVDQEGLGVCVQFCDGTDESCPPNQTCAIYNDGVLPICLVSCDPLLQDCPTGQSCIDTPNQSFICFNDASGDAGADGDPCPPSDGENSCDPGMWCGAGSSSCEDVNCCTPFCEIGNDACVPPDECISFFGEGSAPPGF
jgi:hypothetical protein